MNFRPIRKARRGLRPPPGVFVPVLIFVAALLMRVISPGALSRAAQEVAAPFLRTGRFFERSFDDAALYFFSKRTLLRELRELREELLRYDILLADRRALLEENEALRALDDESLPREARVRAAVLAAPPRSLYDTLLLDAGAREGVSVGDEVRVGAVAVGTVRTVFPETSLAELFSAPGRVTPVELLHRGVPVPVEAVGEGGGAFRATLPRHVPVEVGDPVTLPAREGPIVFGAIEATRGGETSSFRTIYWKLPVSLWSLLFVDIVRTYLK